MAKIDSYKLARVSAIALPVFFFLFVVATNLFQEPRASAELFGPISALITLLGTITSIAVAVSTILIGWRNERRQAREAELRIKQLQLQLEEMEKRNNKGL